MLIFTVIIKFKFNFQADLPDDKQKKPEQKARENGAKVTNGEQNGDTVSSDEDLQSDVERDEMFPELAYEDSDGECFEPPTPEGLPSRSYTRRSQVCIRSSRALYQVVFSWSSPGVFVVFSSVRSGYKGFKVRGIGGVLDGLTNWFYFLYYLRGIED